MSGAYIFPHSQDSADQLNPAEAAQLIAMFRLPGEPTFLQTFADGPDELYHLDAWTGKDGSPRTTQKYALAKADGKGRTIGRTASEGSFTLAEIEAGQFMTANIARVGVFWTVNVLKPGATRRKAEEVERVAAVFVDLDGQPLPADGFHLPPTAVVESSAGRFHAYWAVADLPLEEFSTVQKHLASLYGGDMTVHDLPRVMRLPGYWHGKQEPGFLTRILEARLEAQYSREELLGSFPRLRGCIGAAEAERVRRLQNAQQRHAETERLRDELQSGPVTDQAGARAKWAQVARLGGIADVLSAGVGQRNTTLNAVSYRFGRIVGAGLLDEAEARRELLEAGERVGLEPHELERTVSSGLEAGEAEPVDPSKIGEFAGKKKDGKKKAGGNLRQAAGRVETEADALPAAEDIPDPEGESGTYSGAQVLELLGITWPVVAPDTDKAHAYRLQRLAGDDLAYVPELGGYLVWNDQRWLSGGKDGAGQVEAQRRVQGLGVAMRWEVERLLALYTRLDVAAKRLAGEGKNAAAEAGAMAQKASAMERAYHAHARAARATESDNRQKAILNSARTLYRKDVSLFEPRPWKVGFQNGVWDKSEFRPARRQDYLLTLAPVEYQPDADRADWLEVLERITGGDADLAHTLQDVAGYAFSGASTLRTVPFPFGPKGTGKSTYTELLSTALGDMAATIDPKLLSADAARERLGAAIWGKLMVLCAEAGNARLDAEALKTLSGADRLSVRKLYAEGFTARPSHVLFMVANDPPRVEAYDDALKDRVLALPFDHPLREGVSLLGGRRLEELRQDPNSDLVRGFTAWAVEGLDRVYRNGDIYRAEVCQAATRDFWDDVDPLRDFWLEQNVSELVMGVGAGAFRKRYQGWCDELGARPLGAQNFGKACTSVGLERVKSGVVRWKLTNRGRFPGQEDLGNLGNLETNSPKPNNSLLIRERARDFRGTGSETAQVAQVAESVGVASDWEVEL